MSDNADAAFAASLAAAIAMEPKTDEQSEGSSVDDAEEPAVSGESPDSAADGAGEDGGDESDDDSEDAGEGSPSLDAVKEQFLAGDKAGALKALGLDPKILDLNDAKFRTMRQGLKEADTKLAEATRLHTEAESKAAETKRMYELGKKELGPVLQMKRLLAKGDYASAKDLLEACAPPGTTYRQIAEGIAAAASGMSAAEQLYRRKLRELDEKENAPKDEPEKKPAPTTATSKNIEGARKVLTVHGKDLLDVPGAAEALVRVAAENWDAEKKGFKVPKAQLVALVKKDPVISQLLELKALKASKGKKAPEPEEDEEEQPVARDKSGRFRERPRQPPAPKLTPAQQKEADREARLRKSIAEAAAMEKASNRGKGRR